MMIIIVAHARRMIVELALGHEGPFLVTNRLSRIMPPPSVTTADRAADLLAAVSALNYLRDDPRRGSPEPSGSPTAIQGLVAELIAAQNDDGGWPWVAGPPPAAGQNQRPLRPATG